MGGKESFIYAVDHQRHTPVATHCAISQNRVKKLLLQLKEHDEYTFLHSINVGVLALDFGFYLNLDMTFLQNLFLAGILHDIGKLNIPSELLNKKEPLTDTEFAQIRCHPEDGYMIAKNHLFNRDTGNITNRIYYKNSRCIRCNESKQSLLFFYDQRHDTRRAFPRYRHDGHRI